MRKQKPDNLKAERLQIAVPQSFARYAQVKGCSAIFQEMLANRVLGVSRAEFRQMYAGERDIRFKPEPIEKAYIRAARWILESKIHEIRLDAPFIWFDVEWTVTGNRCWCRIVSSAGPGYMHVIYDEVAVPPKAAKSITPVDIPVDWQTSKERIMINWANYSYCGAEGTGNG